ncbi:MAG: hypothetical protein WAR76_02950 [Xanthobacteraceae bacterium]|jgi:hypothetical protein
MTLRSTHVRIAAVALVFATALLTGPPARAFSINSGSGTNSDSSVKFGDPDDQIIQNFGSGGSSSGQSGPTVQFGVQRPSNPFQGSTGGVLQPLGPRSLGSGNNN